MHADSNCILEWSDTNLRHIYVVFVLQWKPTLTTLKYFTFIVDIPCLSRLLERLNPVQRIAIYVMVGLKLSTMWMINVLTMINLISPNVP